MKNTVNYTLLLILLCIGLWCNAQERKSAYFIYTKRDDKLLYKVVHKKAISVEYLCSCYAHKNNLSFRSADTLNSYFSDTLPKKYYSMREFAQVALKQRLTAKTLDFQKADFFVIEETESHKYRYYKMKFYSIDNDE